MLAQKKWNIVLHEIHKGIYGNHAGAKFLVEYYWPTLQKDTYDIIRACDKCHCFANVQTRPVETVTPISSPWPFAQWGIDIMGPFTLGKKQLRFIVVVIDYFTKWVKAKLVTTITKAKVTSFVWKNIICRFGVPCVIISDNGKQFDNPKFSKFC